MNLAEFPRRHYTEGRTPIEFLPNFTKALNGPQIYIKRDDQLGLFPGGNKTRKLEFLMADALEKGADTIITCGAVQSNHCRITLSAAVKEGLKCWLVLEERVKDSYDWDANGNNFLYHLFGTEKYFVVPGGSNMAEEMEKAAEEARKLGRKPYIIPGGGSNDIGALGYVAAAEETLSQLYEKGLKIDHIYLTSGSAGTHAGFLTGLKGNNAHIPVTGVGVNRKKDLQEKAVYDLSQKLAVKLRLDNPVQREEVVVDDGFIGAGYSLPTDSMVEAVQLLARTEGIPLDPVYTGKAMAGLIAHIREGRFKKEDKILFLHTGGSPALFVYTDVLRAGKDVSE